ncbi:hypothetical protein ACLOJK_030557 [Asimina triloba]
MLGPTLICQYGEVLAPYKYTEPGSIGIGNLLIKSRELERCIRVKQSIKKTTNLLSASTDEDEDIIVCLRPPLLDADADADADANDKGKQI